MFKIIENKEVGPDIFKLALRYDHLSQKPKPGQFFNIKVSQELSDDPLLRRPFSIFDFKPEEKSVEFIYKVVGKGTKVLSKLKTGTKLDVLGPLGSPFSLAEMKKEWVVELEFVYPAAVKLKQKIIKIKGPVLKDRFLNWGRLYWMLNNQMTSEMKLKREDLKLNVSMKARNNKELKLKNPLITASGTCGNGKELADFFDINQLGAFTTKGITVKAQSGNKTPRIAETSAGILNSIGLENPGVDSFVADVLPETENFTLPILANISGYSKQDFIILAEKLEGRTELAGIEVNLSCPNIKGGGMIFGTDPEKVFEITKKVREIYSGYIIVKLTPNITDITETAIAAEEAGADAVAMINTLSAMKIDIDRQKPLLANTFGGLSGPAVRPVAVKMVYDCYKKIDIPILGLGGVRTGSDVIEFMLAGACSVGIGTINMIEPAAALRIIREIEDYMLKHQIQELSSIIGAAH
jgi:dihydroorotate dehydrogenase (NAD+) catalytic subunit